MFHQYIKILYKHTLFPSYFLQCFGEMGGKGKKVVCFLVSFSIHLTKSKTKNESWERERKCIFKRVYYVHFFKLNLLLKCSTFGPSFGPGCGPGWARPGKSGPLRTLFYILFCEGRKTFLVDVSWNAIGKTMKIQLKMVKKKQKQ